MGRCFTVSCHSKQSLKLPGSTQETFPAACPHLFVRHITEGHQLHAKHHAQLTWSWFASDGCRTTSPFDWSLQSVTVLHAQSKTWAVPLTCRFHSANLPQSTKHEKKHWHVRREGHTCFLIEDSVEFLLLAHQFIDKSLKWICIYRINTNNRWRCTQTVLIKFYCKS